MAEQESCHCASCNCVLEGHENRCALPTFAKSFKQSRRLNYPDIFFCTCSFCMTIQNAEEKVELCAESETQTKGSCIHLIVGYSLAVDIVANVP